jgi:hypothetical protein
VFPVRYGLNLEILFRYYRKQTNPSSRQRGCYVRTNIESVQLVVKKKNSGHESQGA